MHGGNQDKLIYASITELAELAGTSEATVTRVCTKLGYSGFQALKVSVARDWSVNRKRFMKTSKLTLRLQ